MPPPLLVDLDNVDLNKVLYTREQIYQFLPQSYEFEQLDGVCHATEDEGVAFRDVRDDEWWVRGHIPGNPIFPGVLMLETAAQMAGFFVQGIVKKIDPDTFIAFGGVENCKFRDAVIPPSRIYFLLKPLIIKPRKTVCNIQGIVDRKLVFETQIIGMPMKGVQQ